MGCLLAAAGALLTLAHSLPVLVLGLAFLTAGFFAVHGVASGWGARPRARRRCRHRAGGLAVPVRLLPGLLGVWSLAGSAWTAGWPGVVTLAVVLISATALLALLLRSTATLLPGPAAAGHAAR